jgi:hypothetical protein
MYVYVLRDKENGLTTTEISRWGLVHTANAEVMFRVSVPDAIAAQHLIDDLNIPFITFGQPDAGRVDRALYAAALMDKAHASNEAAQLREEVDLQAGFIRHKNVVISNLEAEIVDNRNRVSSMKTILENIMNALALDAALERTHRQRNSASRFIVRLIKRVLDSDPLDMDDIPF